jgi:hypothetical protein
MSMATSNEHDKATTTTNVTTSMTVVVVAVVLLVVALPRSLTHDTVLSGTNGHVSNFPFPVLCQKV